MSFDFKSLKKELKPEFHRNYEKYYPVESLTEMCFSRRICSSCGRGFWSLEERDVCDEPVCSGGYRFMGENLTRKKFSYKGAWDEFVSVFENWDYMPIDRYPVVCRWYEDLYFVSAGVNIFQPYVIAGDVEPPAPAVLEPQFCLRFPDVDSVGVTGRHYTGFIMAGQHAFNTPYIDSYFKEEGIQQIHEFLTQGLGIDPSEIVYHEDVWAGGGNFGPSMEYFCRGLELGNQVYMQYRVLPNGNKEELDTKVIDMGAGLERWSWFSQGAATSYETVFPGTLDFMATEIGLKRDKTFWMQFGRYSGLLDLDEMDDLGGVWNTISEELDTPLDDLKRKVFEQAAFYSIADHARTLVVAIHDGALPSNVGGGYNLRMLLRRCWDLIERYQFNLDMHEVLERQIIEFGKWFSELHEKGSLHDIVDVEHERYLETAKKSRNIINSIRASGRHVSVEDLVEMYDSQGVRPELIENHVKDGIPDNFYSLVEERHRKKEVEEDSDDIELPELFRDTVLDYYEDQQANEFDAKVVAVVGDWVILDRTLFYPEGGGQESDEGTLNGVKVLEVRKKSGQVLHRVQDNSSFSHGVEVKGVLNEDRRFQLMQHHTATHIVNAAAQKVLGPHVWQAGAHKSVESSRLDITHYKAVSIQEMKRIEDAANRIVEDAVPVRVSWMSRDKAERKHGMRIYQGGAVPGTDIRIVEVEGIDAEACGGTHLSNTGEVGGITILSAKRIQDGVVRLEFKAGGAYDIQDGLERRLFDEVLGEFTVFNIKDRDYDKYQLRNAAQVFSVEPEMLAKTVARFAGEMKELVRETGVDFEDIYAGDITDASRTLFSRWKALKKMKKEQEDAFVLTPDDAGEKEGVRLYKYFSEGVNLKTLTDSVRSFIEERPESFLAAVNIVGEKANVICASSSEIDAKEVAGRLCGKLGGGAGGNKKLSVGGGSGGGAFEALEALEV